MGLLSGNMDRSLWENVCFPSVSIEASYVEESSMDEPSMKEPSMVGSSMEHSFMEDPWMTTKRCVHSASRPVGSDGFHCSHSFHGSHGLKNLW